MSTEKIRVGVFGVGSLGQHHARVYAELPDAELVGVYDPDRERAHVVATRHDVRAYDEPMALATEIEAASVVAPTDRHREVAGALLSAGVHLLVEKPIASSTREAEELVTLAREKKLVLQVGHIERFNPVMSYLEQTACRPRFIEAHRMASYPPSREGARPRGTEVSVVLDLMIHDLEIVLHMVHDRITDLRAVGVPVLSTSEDIAHVRLEFAGGCVANITASRISLERMRKIRVFTDNAYLSLDYQNQCGKIVRHKHGRIIPEEVPIEKGEPLVRELSSFVACVTRRASPLVSGTHGAEALRLAVDIVRSIRKAAR